MSNAASKVRILYLEADNADAESVGALVGIVREVQGGRTVPSVDELATATAGALIAEADAPAALPAPKAKRVYKPRASKSAAAGTGKGTRTKGAANDILAAFKTTTTPDRNAMARQIYGDASDASLKRIGRMIWSLASKGRLKSIGDGAYKVVG